ncbi:MAG TPA: 4-hydroxy-3-methylbut-2-enyl diphosphate reductase [Allosphingosinicella sp.]|jgi:4-hydroxy-3-methylbut-2-enyl diphosphate reductase
MLELCLPSPAHAFRDGDAADLRPEVQVLLAAPRGFCAGVRRAIDAVRDALALHGAPVFVRRPIVHNLTVMRMLAAEGAVFIQELSEAPEGAVVILSAHGVAPIVKEEAERRRLRVYDAVCPLVAKVHREVQKHHQAGRHVVLVGHEGHPEIVGTLGHLPEGAASLVRSAADVAALDLPPDLPVGVAVQTTYSVHEAAEMLAAIKGRFADVATPPRSDICYATTNRQGAVRAIAARADAVIVAGEDFSSNACRLAELAAAAGCASVQLVSTADALDWARLRQSRVIGVTAAASTPESVVDGIIDALRARYRLRIEEVAAAEETIMFRRVAVA